MNCPNIPRYPDLSALLIKNGPSDYETLQLFLLESEVRLLVADDAEHGESLYADELPDLVFICMDEGLDAFAMTTRLRKRWGCRAHTIIIGGDNSANQWKMAFESGAMAYLPDPDNREELDATIQRLQDWMMLTCTDASQQMLELGRTTRLLDALPMGVILIGRAEQIITANKAAIRMTGLESTGSGQQLDTLFLQIYGVNRDANLLLIRSALHGSTTWKDTVYCGQNGLTLRLELLPLIDENNVPSAFRLLILQDIGKCPTSQPYQTILSAAAFDLLFSGYFSPREQTALATVITEGNLPTNEQFRLDELFSAARQKSSNINNLLQQVIPEYLNSTYSGPFTLLKDILTALFTWALESAGDGTVLSSVSLTGRENNKLCLRFSITTVNRRLTRSSYQRGDEAITQQLTHSGITALKNLHGLGLATSLTTLIGSSLILKTVSREGKTAQFDIWLQQVLDGSEIVSTDSKPALTPSPETVQMWDSATGKSNISGLIRVLVAEDNPLEQMNIRNLMERLGHQIVLVENGREAVEECENNHFDLILMDILMPVMDGFEAVRLIREHERLQGNHTPIIALTSYSLKAVQERCAKAGMTGYLSKPVTQDKLDELVKSFFTTKMTASPDTQENLETNTVILPTLNLELVINNFGSDVTFYKEMLDLFTTHGYPLLDELLQQLQSDNPNSDLAEDAHKLKGMAANIGAAQLAEICGELQNESQIINTTLRQHYLQRLNQIKTALISTVEQLDWNRLREKYSMQKA